MKEYQVQIVETLSTIVKVKAKDADDAREYASQQYYAEEIVLDSSDFDYVTMEVINDSDNTTDEG